MTALSREELRPSQGQEAADLPAALRRAKPSIRLHAPTPPAAPPPAPRNLPVSAEARAAQTPKSLPTPHIRQASAAAAPDTTLAPRKLLLSTPLTAPLDTAFRKELPEVPDVPETPAPCTSFTPSQDLTNLTKPIKLPLPDERGSDTAEACWEDNVPGLRVSRMCARCTGQHWPEEMGVAQIPVPSSVLFLNFKTVPRQ